jgi:hypothetical protein
VLRSAAVACGCVRQRRHPASSRPWPRPDRGRGRWRVAGRLRAQPRCQRGCGARPCRRRRVLGRGAGGGGGGRLAAGHRGRVRLREQRAGPALLEPVHRARCRVVRRPLCPRLGAERMPCVRTGPSRGSLRVPACRSGAGHSREGVRGSCPVRACHRVPVAILTPYWSKLLYASALPFGAPFEEGFVLFRSPARHLRHQGDYAPSELAVFACDFSRLEPRLGLPYLSACPGAVAPRPRTACGSVADLHDRLRLREALLAQRGALGGGGAE